MAPTHGVLVDAYSTGNYLPPAFARLGVELAHLQSTPELMPSMLAPARESYTDFLVHGAGTEHELKERAPLFVLAGQEAGVPLADQLSETLGLRTNGAALSAARRDKQLMIDAIRAAGLRTAEQLRTADAEAAVAWADAGGHWPCVAKPLASASTDGVFICRGPEDLRRAFPAILGARDIFDHANTDVLVQSFLEGTEYIVDTVSVDGRAFVCGVWRYEKRLLDNGKPIYNRDILLPHTDPVVGVLAAYTRDVLAALDVRNGPAHSEVIVGPAGPAIVEVGARLNGNMHPGFHQLCLGNDQAELTALAYVRPARFHAEHADGGYRRRQPAVVYNAPTTHDGRVVRVADEVLDAIRARPSVVDLTVKRSAGDRIVPTRDLLTSPLRVFMTAADDATLEADYRFVESVREDVYEVAP